MKTAFPRFRTPVDIRLYSNIPFDNTYAHHSLISSKFAYNGTPLSTQNAQLLKESFIDRKDYSKTGYPYYYPRYDLTGEFNFDYSNGLVGSVVLELTPAQTNANYMRVVCRGMEMSDVYYFFITGIQQINYDTYRLTIEVDVLMTYQDEFLEGMSDIPVLTKRKHCNRYSSYGVPHCADFRNNEDAFAGIKPSITLHDSVGSFNLVDDEMNKFKGILWLYVCVDADTGDYTYNFDFEGVDHPLAMMVVPMKTCSYKVGGQLFTMTPSNMIYNLINEGKVHGCKISPYPPFNDDDITITESGDNYIIESPHLSANAGANPNDQFILTYETDFSKLVWSHVSGASNVARTTWCIQKQKQNIYPFKSVSLNITTPTTALGLTGGRVRDARTLFSPFRKYTLNTLYSNAYEFFPELLFGEWSMSDDELTFETSTTAYIGDNNIITYLKPVYIGEDTYGYEYYKELNIGLSASINYNLPAGTSALDVFNATQSQSFYTSKVATGITAGLGIVGGLATTGVGVATKNPMLVAGGLTALAGGVESAVVNAKSVNAKIEDLQNTPDSFNVAGSNFCSDYGRTLETFPFIVVYECATATIISADELFYDYGYAISRMCYFNTELYYNIDASQTTDDNLFTRTIFNYIEISDDITNKINYDMPLVVKQKLSKIFNDGITLWSFFNKDDLWHFTPTTDSDYYVDRWFMKDQLNNTEYNIIVSL